MTIDIDKLEALAKAANEFNPYWSDAGSWAADLGNWTEGEYVAALDPELVLALIAEVRALRASAADAVAETLRMADAQSKLQRSLVIQECADAVAGLAGDEYSPGWNNAISDAVDRLNAMRGEA